MIEESFLNEFSTSTHCEIKETSNLKENKQKERQAGRHKLPWEIRRRIEALNKQFNSLTLASEATVNLARSSSSLPPSPPQPHPQPPLPPPPQSATPLLSDSNRNTARRILRPETEAGVVEALRKAISEISTDRELIENTPRRWVEAFNEWFANTDVPLEEIALMGKSFESANTDLIIADNIRVYAACQHHLCPFSTTVAIGVVPGGRILGLSKFSRIVQAVARRFSSGLVENFVTDVAKVLKIALKTEDVMVVAYSRQGDCHTCAASRGARDQNMQITTSHVGGQFRSKPILRQEFLSLIKKSGD